MWMRTSTLLAQVTQNFRVILYRTIRFLDKYCLLPLLSSASMMTTTPFPFLELPAELRNMIYKLVINYESRKSPEFLLA